MHENTTLSIVMKRAFQPSFSPRSPPPLPLSLFVPGPQIPSRPGPGLRRSAEPRQHLLPKQHPAGVINLPSLPSMDLYVGALLCDPHVRDL